jgi:hypothetical protein
VFDADTNLYKILWKKVKKCLQNQKSFCIITIRGSIDRIVFITINAEQNNRRVDCFAPNDRLAAKNPGFFAHGLLQRMYGKTT